VLVDLVVQVADARLAEAGCEKRRGKE